MNSNQKKSNWIFLCAVLQLASGLQGFAAGPLPPRTPAAVHFPVSGEGMEDPKMRKEAVDQLRQTEKDRRENVHAWGQQLGLPLREVRPDGGGRELMDVDGEQPLYYATCNANAGISSGANRLWVAPYGVTGGRGVIGLWDGSSARTTHREFDGRVTAMDGSSATYDHSTHVAGTLCASGVVTSAKGMAPGAQVDSYDWNNDTSEMTERGASYPGERNAGTNMLYLSSHSYGYTAGWYYTASTPTWIWYGSGTTATGIEDDFGKYSSYTRDVDALTYSLPYYLPFWAAGNDRTDNPSAGSSVYLSPTTTTINYYDAASHPGGDGTYRGGYDTISFHALAKNVVTIGAVGDAVSGGVRSLAGATMQSFSSWGPTDDGRIKPDLVANGASLYSTSYSSDSAYTTMSGTSMATPSAAGTAHLLGNLFSVLFTNQFMRASTLKALLIHTADDLGLAGPDYQYGWGLINATNAAVLLRAYKTTSGARQITEDHLSTSRTAVQIAFVWDGVSPIKATLCWTDPAGASTTSGDSRTARLVNNLDLRVIGPSGTVYQPWVMPFVGLWTTNAMSAAATTGSNYTDNVEQVLVSSPGVAGTYTARVTYAGTLTNGDQPFSLILSGSATNVTLSAPQITGASARGSGTQLFTLTGGSNLLLGGTVSLSKEGATDIVGEGVQAFGDTALARIDTTAADVGFWNLVYTNPDGKIAVVTNAAIVRASLWTENFETNDLAGRGWTFLSTTGTSAWGLSTAGGAVSGTQALFSVGSSVTSDTSAVSPGIPISVRASALVFSFMQKRAFTDSADGGVLELAVDSEAWVNVTNAASGATFVLNGYNATLTSTTQNTASPLGKIAAWSGSSSGFEEVQVALTNTVRFAGHTLYIRWRMGTSKRTASPGWTIDDGVLLGVVPPSKATLMLIR